MPHTFLTQIRLHLFGIHNDFSRGECYEFGRHVEKNIDTALIFYRRAMRSGDARAYFRLGKWYDGQQDSDQKAAQAYYGGAILKHPESKVCLEQLAEGDSVTAKYLWARVFARESNWEKALEWYRKAVDKEHSPMMYHFGQLYRENRKSSTTGRIIIAKNIAEELKYYREAAASGSKYALNELVTMATAEARATVHLAKMYELGEGGLHENITRACEYYLAATKQGCEDALPELEKLLVDSENGKLSYEVAEIYQARHQLDQAIKWYFRAVKQQFSGASSRIWNIANSNSEFAYIVAQCYEKGLEAIKNTLMAFAYYAISARQDHSEAKEYLERMALSGDPDAQYNFGYYYHRHKKNVWEAILWCMKAGEQGHTKALEYLTTVFRVDIYLKIAKTYETGEDGLHKNITRALEFYTKASDLKDKRATLYLAHFYQVDHAGIEKNLEQAFKNYMKAVKLGCQDAWVPLERLGEEMSAKQQLELSHLYRSFSNDERASYWCSKAKEIDVDEHSAALYLGRS
jgi:TPR repeat protein